MGDIVLAAWAMTLGFFMMITPLVKVRFHASFQARVEMSGLLQEAYQVPDVSSPEDMREPIAKLKLVA